MAGEHDVSPALVEKYLQGIDYPAQKEDLIEQAEDNNAPDEVLDMLEQLPDTEYDRPTDVAKAIGKLE